jgi:hypothetical protein
MLMSSKNKVARLHYMANSFRMLTAGDHVVCAETGQAIPLEELRYWSDDEKGLMDCSIPAGFS